MRMHERRCARPRVLRVPRSAAVARVRTHLHNWLMQNLRMRVMSEADIPAALALNNAAQPAMNPLTEDDMRELFSYSDIALVGINHQRELIAFLICLSMGKPYTSENYRWFEERGVRHLYVDRVVVAPSAKGTGIGTALYESVFAHARQIGANEVTAEVNLDPPNPGGVAFHERLGFRRLAEQSTRGGTVHVALMARSVY
jgi:predicted GNAT superfamily acetyltransferase